MTICFSDLQAEIGGYPGPRAKVFTQSTLLNFTDLGFDVAEKNRVLKLTVVGSGGTGGGWEQGGGGGGGTVVAWLDFEDLDNLSTTFQVTIGTPPADTVLTISNGQKTVTINGQRGGNSGSWAGGLGGLGTISYTGSWPKSEWDTKRLIIKGNPGEGYGRHLFVCVGGNSALGGGQANGGNPGYGGGGLGNGSKGGQGIVVIEY